MKKQRKFRLSSTQIIVFGFLAIILIGTLLLMLPIASTDGSSTPFVDALFTATSATCVTGLMTLPVFEHWTLFGQIVLLVLIQIGGLGIVATTFTFFVVLKRRITMKDRVLINEAYALDTYSDLGKAVLKIVKGTLLIELIGAIMYSFQFIPEYGAKGIWYSVFHAISAFCNAGIDIIGGASFCGYTENYIVNLATIFLIVMGGIGFCVWWDIQRVAKEAFKKKLFRKQLFHRLSIHSKLAITMTLLLIVSGTVLFLVLEWSNPDTLGALPVGKRWLAALFQSVTTRTAGFATIPQENFTDAGSIVTMLLMFIGGSPAGTAGGVKTTTIAMIVITVIMVVKGKQETELFKRRIPKDNIRTGLAVVSISAMILLTGILVLSCIEQASLLNVVYEAVSALGTVGLSRNFTGTLQNPGKFLIILLMFIGRIGPITMAFAFRIKGNSNGKAGELAEQRILVG